MVTTNRIFGIGRSIKTLAEASLFCPAAFSTDPHPERTDKYSFISTEDIVHKMEELGWEVTHAIQSGRSRWARHIVRMTNPSLGHINIPGDKITPQIIIDNSHDGLTQAMIHMGIFRFASHTGLIISSSVMRSSFTFKHIGLDKKEIEELMIKVADNYAQIAPNIETMTQTELTQEEKEEFAIRAIAAREPWRFLDENDEILVNKIKKLNDIKEILTPVRQQDTGNDLWTVFNVIHEKLTNGGYKRLSDSGRKSRTRAIVIPSRNVKFNKSLWELAETYIHSEELV